MSDVNEDLKILLNVIDKICEQPEKYAWFKKELQKRFGGTSNDTTEKPAVFNSANDSDDRIKAIYEYCIHELLKKQADTFFMDLPFPEKVTAKIKTTYILMEKSKLYDDFDSFSFYLNKQIDLIFGHIVKDTDFSEIIQYFYPLSHYINTVKSYDNERKIIYKDKSEYDISDRKYGGKVTQISKFLYGDKQEENTKKKLIELSSSMKAKILLYFFVYGTLLHNNNYQEFDTDYKNLNDLVNCRNYFTHEGGKIEDYQSSSYEKVMRNPIKYYFVFISIYCKLIASLRDYKTQLDKMRSLTKGVPVPVTVAKILPSACFVRTNDNTTIEIGSKFLKKCEGLKEGDEIYVRFSNGKIAEVIR